MIYSYGGGYLFDDYDGAVWCDDEPERDDEDFDSGDREKGRRGSDD